MDEDTTTDHDVQATGADEALPVEQEQSDAAAEQTVDEPSDSNEDVEVVETQSDPSDVDDKLRKYATSQGLDLGSPSEIKAARLAMKAQSEATKNSLRASELEKATAAISDEDAVISANATGQDPELIKRLQRMEVKEMIRDFWSQDTYDRSYESAMTEIVKQKPYLAGDLESLYATAVMKSGGVAAVKSQARRETLTELAHKQQAAVPTGSATSNGTPREKPFAELSIEEMEKKLKFVRQ